MTRKSCYHRPGRTIITGNRMQMTSKRVTALWLICVGAALTGCYLQTRNFQFLYDSVGFVLHNPHIRTFSLDNTRWILTHAWLQNWQPLTWLSHTVDFTLFGTWGGGPHLVNLALHLCNSILLYFLVKRLTSDAGEAQAKAGWIAGITAFIFALHPQHVESVAMIAERKDMLYGLFTLLCAFAWLRQRQYVIGSPQRRRWKIWLILLYLLDLMAKPMAVTLPLVLMAMDMLLPGPGQAPLTLWQSFRDKLPLWVLAVLIAIITLTTQQSAMFPWQIFTPLHRLAHMMHNLGFYIWKFLVPLGLSPYYPFVHLDDMLKMAYWLPGFLLLVSVTLACGYAWYRNRPGFMFGWIFFLVTLAPVNGFLQVGSASATDHYVYMASIPFGAFLAWLAVTLAQRLPRLRSVVFALTACYLSGLVMLTYVQVGFWQSPFTLWGRALELYPSARLPRRNLAISYMQAGAWDKALAEARKIDPPDPSLVREIRAKKWGSPRAGKPDDPTLPLRQ